MSAELVPHCTGFRYPVNPSAPEEGTDIWHDHACLAHPDAVAHGEGWHDYDVVARSEVAA